MLQIGKTTDGRAFTLPLDALTMAIAVLGRRGSGKSFTASVMGEGWLAQKQQIVVIDPTGAWWGLRSSADGASDGFPVLVIGGDHGDLPIEEAAGEMLASAIVENRFSAVLDLSVLRKGAAVRFVGAFAEALYRLNREPMHLFIDEADAFAPQVVHGDTARTCGATEDLVRRGRKRGIGCTLITQRPQAVNKSVLTQCEMLVALRMGHPRDIDAIEEWVDVHADADEAKGMIESLPALPTGTAWFWSPLMGLFERVQVRQRTTFDSGATPKPGQAVREPKRITKVDVAALGEKIKGMAEKAKANDPAILKRRIAELERQASAQRTAREVIASAPAAMTKIERVEVPILTKEDRTLLQAARDGFFIAATQAAERVSALERRIEGATIRITAQAPRAPGAVPRIPVQQRAPVAPRAERSERGDCEKLSKAERMILTVLVQHGPKLKVQVAVMTGYSVTGGGFGNAVGALATKGLLTRNGETLEATAEGTAALGTSVPALPTGQALIEYWRPQLTKAEREILDVLVRHYPQALSKEQLASETESHYEPTGGGFGNALGRLRTLELVVGRTEISASPHLMEA